jgi:hypothetical protein
MINDTTPTPTTYVVTLPVRKYEIIHLGQSIGIIDAQLANHHSIPGTTLFVVFDLDGEKQVPRVVGQFNMQDYSWREIIGKE